MIWSLFLIFLGLALLVVGGEVLLRGAVGLARVFKLTPAVIGLTVVAAGTSVPELAVSLIAVVKGNNDIAVANVVGSNIFNIAFILGVCALVTPLSISGSTVRLEYPVLAFVTLVFLGFCRDGTMSRADGVISITLYVIFTVFLILYVRRQLSVEEASEIEGNLTDPNAGSIPLVWCTGIIAVGVGLLAFGAQFTVSGAVEIALALGLSERIVGLTIVACGTSLPEVVTSLVASYRGRDDVAVGNVIGSNIFNILCILGLAAVIKPLPVDASIIESDNWWMLGTTLLLFPLMFTGKRLTRGEGGLLLGAYLFYLWLLISH